MCLRVQLLYHLLKFRNQLNQLVIEAFDIIKFDLNFDNVMTMIIQQDRSIGRFGDLIYVFVSRTPKIKPNYSFASILLLCPHSIWKKRLLLLG